VHDGARPWASPALAARVAEAAAEGGAAIPIIPLVDTPKEIGPDGILLRHPLRASMGGAQTPQGFRFRALLAAHRKAAAEKADCTDDAELWDRYVGPVASVPGEAENRKVTYARDLPAANEPPASAFRVGQGWDLHRLVPGRALMLGGVEVPSPVGEEAHSDGDVLLHAIIDALLGAAALGDIGTYFPPSDEKWRNADSKDLARGAAALVRDAGWVPGNLDCTIVLEKPRLGPLKDAMRASVAACLGMSPDAVSVLDMNGNLLGRPRAAASLDSGEPSEAVLDYRHKVEADLLAKVNSTLEALLGPDKFRAGVSVECDFSGGEESAEVFDPAHSVMLSSQRTEDSSGPASSSGVPGTASTLPRPASRPGGSSSHTSRVTENIAYQSSRTVRKTRMPAGSVRKMSLAVLVDQELTWQPDKKGYQRVLQPPSPEKLKIIRDLVAGVTGFSPERGDQLVWETAKQPLTARSIGALRKRLENLAIDTITLRHDSAYDEMIGQPLRSSNTLDVRLNAGD